MAYLVLARKYRSSTFEEVVGQEPIARTLVNAIRTGRVHHAYLFTGTRGVGKTTMARILAKALNCLASDAPTPAPCNQCDACVSIARGDDLDVVEIDGASNRGIDEIRELRANAIFRPARCRHKVYYIDEVHQITRDAFNALLKTLEEPPAHVKFIFSTTEAEKVPATIVSRCQRFDFRDIPTRLIAEHLRKICGAEQVEAADDALFRIARAAAGSMRDGLSVLDQILAAGGGEVTDEEVVRTLGTPPDERMLAMGRAIADGDTAGALGELDAVLSGGVSLSGAATALGDVFRNLMIAATCGPDSELIELPEAQRKAAAELAKKFSTPALVQAVGIAHNTAFRLRSTSVGRPLLEATIVRLAAADQFVDPASLIERLEALGPGEKKKPAGGAAGRARAAPALADRGPGTGARQGARDAGAPGDKAIAWDAAWLRPNWGAVVDALVRARKMQVAGALRPASVEGFSNDVLTLGFDDRHEAVRSQCAGRLSQAICSALTEVAGREIRCEYVSTGGAGAAPAAVPRAPAALTTEQKREIHNDPSVQEVLSLFGGELVDIRRDAPRIGAEDRPDEEETD